MKTAVQLKLQATRVVLLAAAWLASAPSGWTCEMCKNAIGTDRNHLGVGINTSVLFMVSMVFVLFGSFLGVVWLSYRSEGERARNGQVFAPRGKLRWTPSAEQAAPSARDPH